MNSVNFLDDLLSLLTVRLIMTPKDRFVTCEDDEPIIRLKNRLRDFDLLPVSDSKFRYFVSKTEVERLLKKDQRVMVRDIKQPISDKMTILDDEPIHKYLLQWKEPVFVTKQNEVVGIVTPADLNSISSKMVFYILISSFEKLLIKLIKSLNLTRKEIVEYIGSYRWRKARKRYNTNKKGNFQLAIIDCLNTSELIDIAYKNGKIRKLLNLQNESEARKSLKPVEHLRNKIMHAGYSIIQNKKQLIKRRAEYRRIRQHIIDLT